MMASSKQLCLRSKSIFFIMFLVPRRIPFMVVEQEIQALWLVKISGASSNQKTTRKTILLHSDFFATGILLNLTKLTSYSYTVSDINSKHNLFCLMLKLSSQYSVYYRSVAVTNVTTSFFISQVTVKHFLPTEKSNSGTWMTSDNEWPPSTTTPTTRPAHTYGRKAYRALVDDICQ